MENKAISFNILKHPLRGASFIEASAGTGKTYSITSLYLRLILKVGFNLNLQLKVDNILVVTFTKMATSELKTRISLRINSIYKLLTEYKKQISQELGLSEFNLINKNYQDDEIALYLSNYISSFLFPLGNQKLSFENKTHFYSQQDLSNKNNLKKFFRNSIEFLSSSKNSLNYNFIKTDFLNKIDKLTNLKPDYKAKSEDLSKPYTKNNLDSKTQLNLLENILKNNTFDNLIPSLLEFSNSLFKKLILDENDFIELFYNSLIDSIDKNQRILYLSTFMMASNKSYLEATQLYLEKIFINSQDKSFEIIRSIFNKIILKFNHEKDSLEENLEDAFNNKIDNINSSNSLYEKYKNILNNYPQDNLKEILNKSIHEDFNITFQDNNNPLEETKSLIDYLLNLLNQAKDSISDAPIKTIDSFCYQTLEEYAIDAGINYDIEIINSNYELIKEYFIKFWREYFYPLNQEDSSLISKFISRPSSSNIYLISSLIDNGVIQELENEDPKSILINSALNYRKSLQDFKDNWENIKLFLKDNIKTLKEIDSKNTPKALDIFFTEVDSWILENELVPIESIRTKRLTFNILKDYFNDEIIEYLKIFNSNFAISFKNNLLEIIAKFILKNINAYKKLKNQKTYSDVVNYTKDLLINNPSIANNLRNKYPFLIVDEFQDTNITQYNIFQSIYKDILKPITKEKYKKDNQSYSGAIMIGDPKQAIYAFRGADVFAYIEIKKQFNLTYNLDTNYRSSYELINFTNKLFSFNRNILESRLENSTQNYYCFYQDKIYYNLVKSNNKQGSVQLNSKLKKIDPINFYLSPENNIKEIANRCALNIKYYLNNVSNNGNPIYPQDIAIIVQNESEAIIMKNSLNKLNLDSVYLSQKENILRSDTAKEICLILKAFLQPFKEEILIEALNTTIMSLSSQEIFNIKTNESLLNSYINKFNTFSITWYKEGISSALYSFILIYDIFSRSKLYENKRMMIDISHIIEILSLQESKISGTTNLLTWLEKSYNSTDNAEDILRVQDNKNTIKIITFHKSKGLEFDFVWIPFLDYIKIKSDSLKFYHKDSQLIWDKDELNLENNLIETFDEKLRLIYVGITRAKYSLNLFSIQTKKSELNTELKLPWKYLLYKSTIDSLEIHDTLSKSFTANTKIESLENINNLFKKEESKKVFNPQYKSPKYSHLSEYSLNSFSSLAKHQDFIASNLLNKEILDFINLNNTTPDICKFPLGKGPKVGTTIHSIFENIDFTKPILNSSELFDISDIEQYNLSLDQLEVLKNWINNILEIPLVPNKWSLSEIPKSHTLKELRFLFSIKSTISKNNFNSIMNKYFLIDIDYIEKENIEGSIHGFIDLIFIKNNKYYIMDYKTNFLGFNLEDYAKSSMDEAIYKNRYNLQYTIYTLALHRFLKYKIKNYSYDKDIGGVYYAFLRGFKKSKSTGIYFTKPPKELILSLDKLIEDL